MAKLKNCILGLDVSGTIGKAISFVKRQKAQIAEKTPIPEDAKSLAQLSWRTMYQKCTVLWHALSAAEKHTWENLARPLHMTGFAYWQSQCLRPNPGIYLPLQGGTMSGDIDMNGSRILQLLAPVLGHEPATKTYADLFTSQVKVGNSTRNAAGAQTITLGWQPKAVIFLGFVNAANLGLSWGFSDAVLDRCQRWNPVASTYNVTTYCVDVINAAGNLLNARMTLTATGFTLTWTLTGAPFITSFIYLAFR